jgi:hypothetical protein
MKKLSVLMAAMLVVSGSVMAQDEESGAAGSGASAGTIGGIATGTIVAGAIAAGVLAAVVSNNRSDSAPEEEEVATCNPGDGNPSNGVCTGTTVTASGTSTATVAFTYPAIVQ